MTELNRAGQENSLGHIDTTQKYFRNQIDALTDTVRQLGGNPDLSLNGQPSTPLSAPYVIYVDSNIGDDTFVSGDYTDTDDGTFDSKMRRISLQRLECGYSISRPFRTLSRAVIEAGIITSRDYLTLKPAPCGDLVTIVVSSGIHTVLNSPGDIRDVKEWTDGYEPTDADLTAFSGSTGGIILPRGCSIVSLDLRKTIIRPSYVPASADEAADLSNRSAIFLLTGGCYMYGFTIMDKEGLEASHHLLSGFAYAGFAELDSFYAKIRTAFAGSGATGNIDTSIAVPRTSEFNIVGEQPRSPVEPTDTVRSSSPYIYNISLRSEWGMSGMIADGLLAGDSFKSMVVAQYTAVSLQRDLTCWQKYVNGNWVPFSDYNELIAADPNDTRFTPGRQSFHVRTANNAIIQEVSVFAIGQAIHHLAESGSEITITNSNSNFGGCASIADGYKTYALPNDTGWSVKEIQVAENIADDLPLPTIIPLGTIIEDQPNTGTTIELVNPLTESKTQPGVPEGLAALGFTLKEDSYLWVSNSSGFDFRSQLAAVAWDPANPSQITVKTPFETQEGFGPGEEDAGGVDQAQLEGQLVYIRRMADPRSIGERRYSLKLNTSAANSRIPLRDYVVQTDTDASSISSLIPESETVVIAKSGPLPVEDSGVTNSAQIEIRRANGNNTWAPNTYYRVGDPVQHLNKHWICNEQNEDAAFSPDRWQENYVHMVESYRPEDFAGNAQPTVIFDNDTDSLEETTTCGYNFTTVWSTDSEVIAQYQSATDYKGVYSFLLSIGFTASEAHTILTPKPRANRDRNPSTALDGISAPAGASGVWANWGVETRRPTSMRLYSHSWEWSGYLNYTKGLPVYQGELSEANKFTYFFTNQGGGRVYATGYSEEGFAVTPQGYTDIATGDIVPVDQIGNKDSNIDRPTSFASLSVGELEVRRLLNLGTSSVFGSVDWTGVIRIDDMEVRDLLQARLINTDAIRPTQQSNPDLYWRKPFSVYGNYGQNDPTTSITYTKVLSTSSFGRYIVDVSFFSGAVSVNPGYMQFVIHQRASISGAYEVTYETLIDPNNYLPQLNITLTDNNTGPNPERSYTFTIDHTALGANRAYCHMRITKNG